MKRIYYAIGIMSLIISFIFDSQISLFFTSYNAEILNTISIFINGISGYVLFGFVLLFLLINKRKEKIFPLIISFLLYFGLAGILKIIVARPRPFIALDNYSAGDVNPYRSFPSGHATAVFTLIPFFDFKRIVYYSWIFIAVLISLSRVYLGVHYLSDVIAGAIIGLFIGEITPYISLKLQKRMRFFGF